MDELVNRAKNLFTMREYGIITTNEYIEELNKIRKSLGFEKLPVSQIAAQQSVHWTLRPLAWLINQIRLGLRQ